MSFLVALLMQAVAEPPTMRSMDGDRAPSAVSDELLKPASADLRLSIRSDGHVADCSVIRSSGSPELDREGCATLTNHATWSPARDATGHAVDGVIDIPMRWEAPSDRVPLTSYLLDRDEKGRFLWCETPQMLASILRGGERNCGFWTQTSNQILPYIRKTRRGERVRFVFTQQFTNYPDATLLPLRPGAELVVRQVTVRSDGDDRCVFLMPDGGGVVGPDRIDCSRARTAAEVDERLGGGDRRQVVRTLTVEPLPPSAD